MGRNNDYDAQLGEIESCRRRIRELENKVSDLRMSRRVLMNLLEHAQTNRQVELERLYRENARLQKQLSAYARQLWRQNGRLAEAGGGNSCESQAERNIQGINITDRQL